jgi:asparagine synthase (glutamine-hydrolysing)
MCGIAGIYHFDRTPPGTAQAVRAMAKTLFHRGGDDEGFYQNDHVALAHERLSIIDLTGGRQPICNEDGSVVVVFNGEIYNYKELRGQLEKRGHIFSTTSDTEVLVHLFEDQGLELFDKLQGIFAFALWDNRSQRLLLARDHLGVKPLHVLHDKNRVVFASEIKAVLSAPAVTARLHKQAVHYFMNLRYVPGRETLFQGVERVLPGECIIADGKGLRRYRYWKLPAFGSARIAEREAVEGLRHRLFEAVRSQLVADVPVGVYLSGGMDSSSVLAMVRRSLKKEIDTFALGFNEPTDELADAQRVADYFETTHHPYSIDANPLQRLPQVLWHVEEPKINMIQGFLLAQHTRRFNKVALSGLGGDELFAGYGAYQYLQPAQWLHPLLLAPNLHSIMSRLSALPSRSLWRPKQLDWDEYRRGWHLMTSVGDKCQFYCIIRNVWDHCPSFWPAIYGPRMLEHTIAPTRSLFEPFFADSKKSFVEQALRAEMQTKLVDDFLLNEDRVSMAHALEVRVPLLDRELVTFANSLPIHMKISGLRTKVIFKKAMEDVLPDFILKKKKWGFTFNAYIQYQKDLKKAAQDILTPQAVSGLGLFNYRFVEAVLKHPPHPRLRWHYFTLWMMVGFHLWYNLFIHPGIRKA